MAYNSYASITDLICRKKYQTMKLVPKLFDVKSHQFYN